jgi:NAD(P)-dependent dehydrogenase (short-subunit alcohol dehydrogenase family)
MMIPANMQFSSLDSLRYPGMSSPNYTGMRDMFSRYALSKLANILFSKELQRRLDAENIPIISTSCNPGGTNTEGGMSVWPAWMRPIMSRIFAPASKGALPVLFLTSAPEIKRDPAKYKALYYNPSCKAEKPSALAQDTQLARNLWKISEEAVAAYTRT